MPEYSYQALDRSGRQVQGTLDAAGEEVILERLRDLGFYPLRVSPLRRRAARADLTALPLLRVFFHRIRSQHVMTFTRQLATLLGAGMPIMRSLLILREQVESVILKDKIAAMGRDIESGSALSEALARHPRVFDKLYINMVRAGELGGVLETVLNKVADYQERREALRGKIKAAMMYPGVVVTLATIIVSLILWRILPKFQDIYGQMHSVLPAPTRLLIQVSQIVFHETWIVLALAALAAMAFRQMRKREATRYLLDRAALRLPVAGVLLRKIAIARFSGTLSTLIGAGVPILQALDIVRDSSGNEVVARAMAGVYQSVKDGETIHEPLAACEVFPPMVVHMVAVGEETGCIDLMLQKVAESYEREVDNTVNALTSIIEPLLIVFLGVTIGAIVIVLYLPMIMITQAFKP